MTTRKKTSRPDKAVTPRSAKKPRAIIEGSAEDVTPKPTGKNTRAEPAATGPAGTTEKTAKSKSPPVEPPKPRGVGALVATGLAASLATLGIVALAITIAGPPRTWLAEVTGAEDAARLARQALALAQTSSAKLETSIAAQQSDLDSLKAGVAANETMGGAISQLTTKLDRLGELPAQTTALGLRIAAAETRLDTLTANAAARGQTVNSLARALDGAAKAGTSAEAVSAALALAVSRLDTAETRLAKMAKDIQKLSEISPSDASQRAQTEARLADLAGKVDALAARIASEETGMQVAAFSALKSAIAAGRPFADRLAPFKDRPAAATLAKYAATGVPTDASLAAGLTALADQSVDAGRIDGPLGRITSLLGDAVKIRRTDETASVDTPVAKARQALGAGRFAQAADIVSQALNGAQAEAWVTAARDRVEVDTAVLELEASLDPSSGKQGE